MRVACLAVALLLAGCAARHVPEPQVLIQKENLAVAIHCDPDLGTEPDYPDTAAGLAAVPHPDAVDRLKLKPTDVAALTDELDNLGYQVKLLLKGRIARMQRDREKTAAFEGCKGAPH